MTKEELAAELDGQKIGSEIPSAIAKQSGLVVVYGASDDLMEFAGAIDDEVGAYNGATVLLVNGEIFNEDECDSHCKYFLAAKRDAEKRGKSIQVVWGKGGISWQYETDIPHATFDVLEDGEVYCRGIVFSLADVK